MLARVAGPYDVTKLLGDTIETVEKHYAEFVRELRERAPDDGVPTKLETFSKPANREQGRNGRSRDASLATILAPLRTD
jgi:hypothetical protein